MYMEALKYKQLFVVVSSQNPEANPVYGELLLTP